MTVHVELAENIQLKLDALVDSITAGMIQHNMDDPIVKEFFLSCARGCAKLQGIIDELKREYDHV